MTRRINVSYLERLLQKYSLVVLDDESIIYCSTDSTIKPIVYAIRDLGAKLNGKIIADRVIGKAAALVIANVRPGYVYGLIMSIGAKTVLEKYNITYDYDELVSHIRTPSGEICPFEKIVENIEDPHTALKMIASRLGIGMKE